MTDGRGPPKGVSHLPVPGQEKLGRKLFPSLLFSMLRLSGVLNLLSLTSSSVCWHGPLALQTVLGSAAHDFTPNALNC